MQPTQFITQVKHISTLLCQHGLTHICLRNVFMIISVPLLFCFIFFSKYHLSGLYIVQSTWTFKNFIKVVENCYLNVKYWYFWYYLYFSKSLTTINIFIHSLPVSHTHIPNMGELIKIWVNINEVVQSQ